MGYIRNLCKDDGITLTEFAEKSGLPYKMLDDIDLGLKNYYTGKYHHIVKEFFHLNNITFLKFALGREKLVQSMVGITGKTKEFCSNYIKKNLMNDNYKNFTKKTKSVY